MMWRCGCAVACLMSFIALGGCANPQLAAGNPTASLGKVVSSIGFDLKPTSSEDAQRAREDAIIAQAIAAHEMRNP